VRMGGERMGDHLMGDDATTHASRTILIMLHGDSTSLLGPMWPLGDVVTQPWGHGVGLRAVVSSRMLV